MSNLDFGASTAIRLRSEQATQYTKFDDLKFTKSLLTLLLIYKSVLPHRASR